MILLFYLGDLGSGKTKFTEGFLSYWNLDDEISGLFNSTELKLTEKADLVSGIVPVNQLPVVTETESGLITADNNNYLVYLKSVIESI